MVAGLNDLNQPEPAAKEDWQDGFPSVTPYKDENGIWRAPPASERQKWLNDRETLMRGDGERNAFN